MDIRWLLAMAFVPELDWSFFYKNFGFYGLLISYLVIVLGEIAFYSFIVFKILKFVKGERYGEIRAYRRTK